MKSVKICLCSKIYCDILDIKVHIKLYLTIFKACSRGFSMKAWLVRRAIFVFIAIATVVFFLLLNIFSNHNSLIFFVQNHKLLIKFSIHKIIIWCIFFSNLVVVYISVHWLFYFFLTRFQASYTLWDAFRAVIFFYSVMIVQIPVNNWIQKILMRQRWPMYHSN